MRSSSPLVLIPGLLCTPRLFRSVIPRLEAAGVEILVPKHDEANTIAENAKRILDFAPERFHLAGFSYGGYLALEMMAQAASRVDRLALLSTQARADVQAVKTRRFDQIALSRANGSLEEIAELQAPMLLASPHTDPSLRFESGTPLAEVFAMAEETTVDAFERQQRAILSRQDRRSLLPTIQVPTLICAGAKDALLPPPIQQEMADLILSNPNPPQTTLSLHPTAGHMTPLEVPDYLVEQLLQWMEK